MAPSAQSSLLHDVQRLIRPPAKLARQQERGPADLPKGCLELFDLNWFRRRHRVVRVLAKDHPWLRSPVRPAEGRKGNARSGADRPRGGTKEALLGSSTASCSFQPSRRLGTVAPGRSKRLSGSFHGWHDSSSPPCRKAVHWTP